MLGMHADECNMASMRKSIEYRDSNSMVHHHTGMCDGLGYTNALYYVCSTSIKLKGKPMIQEIPYNTLIKWLALD